MMRRTFEDPLASVRQITKAAQPPAIMNSGGDASRPWREPVLTWSEHYAQIRL